MDFARHRGEPLTGRLTLGMIPSLAPYLLPRILPSLQNKFPELKLELRETQTKQLVEEIRSGVLDAAMLALPLREPDIDTLELFDDLFLLAVPASDPRPRERRVAAREIDQSRLILLEDGHCLRDQALDVCSMIDVKESEDYRATSLETLRQMVAAGLGITLLPELATRGPFGSGQGLAVKSFAKPIPTRTVGAVWRKSSSRSEAINAVCDAINTTMHE
jgi:LysR family hydrogen peroxide-inducible transcriptional activator